MQVLEGDDDRRLVGKGLDGTGKDLGEGIEKAGEQAEGVLKDLGGLFKKKEGDK